VAPPQQPKSQLNTQQASAYTTAQAEQTVMDTRPTSENTKPTQYLLGFEHKLDRIDAKKGQVFEQVEFQADDCIVQAFKKVGHSKKASVGGKVTTSYVSSFSFSGHSQVTDDGQEVMPQIEDFLPN